MISKVITYTDYNNTERTEVFYFNLSKAELLNMEIISKGEFSQSLQKIIDTNDNFSAAKILNDLILKAYGEKSEDGKRFIKSAQLSEEFSQTEAYSQLLDEFLKDANAAAEFINGIIPQNLLRQVQSGSQLTLAEPTN